MEELDNFLQIMNLVFLEFNFDFILQFLIQYIDGVIYSAK